MNAKRVYKECTSAINTFNEDKASNIYGTVLLCFGSVEFRSVYTLNLSGIFLLWSCVDSFHVASGAFVLCIYVASVEDLIAS